MLHIILIILKIIGILVLILLGLLLTVLILVLLVPIRYKVSGSYFGKPQGQIRVTWLLRLVSIMFTYDEKLSVVIRLFGIRIRKKTSREKKGYTEDDMVHAMEIPEDEPKKIVPIRAEDENENYKKPDENYKTIKPIQKSKKTCKARLKKIFDKFKDIKDKKEAIQNWITDKNNQKTIKLLFKQMKRLVCHILPRKGKVKVTFGFDDPYTTGQVLNVVSVIYPFCHKHLELYPVFDKQLLEGDGDFKGRIRVGTLLAIAVRVLFDKNFRRLLKRWLR